MKIIDIEVFNDDDGIGFIKHSDMLNLLEQIRIKQEEKNKEIKRLNNTLKEVKEICESIPNEFHDEWEITRNILEILEKSDKK